MMLYLLFFFFFFFNDTATTEIYTLSLHDALPICPIRSESRALLVASIARGRRWFDELLADANANAESIAKRERDRKSTRLNSSHTVISYAVFCLKKKKKNKTQKNHPRIPHGYSNR